MDDRIPLPSGSAQYFHLSPMSLSNIWAAILSAPSSGDALTIAATFHPTDLSNASFPGPLHKLSVAARENATAVHRAFDIPIEGLSSTGWEKWVDDSDEGEDEPVDSLTSSVTPHSPLRAAAAHKDCLDRPSARTGVLASQGADVTRTSSVGGVQGVQLHAKASTTTGTGTTTGTAIAARTATGAGAAAATSTKTAATTATTYAVKEIAISPEDIRHAEALRSWACTRAHTAPPSDAIAHLCRVRSLSLILPRILSDSTQQGQSSNPLSVPSPLATTAPVSVMVAVLHAFCGRPDETGSGGDGDNNGEVISLGRTNSEVLYTHVVMPYLCRLQASVPRDMLQAVTQLCTRYWRPAVKALFEPFSLSSAQPTNPTRTRATQAHSQSNAKRGSETTITPRLNAAVAELLARVAKIALPVESAMQALTLFCAPDAILWPDYAVPLMDALFSRVVIGTIPSMTTAIASSTAVTTTDPGNQLTDDPHQYNHRHDSNGILNAAANAADVFVPALARNASALEKSVRFGKLLFMLVKDVPEIKTRHRDAMETICSRSKVFLAKRALDMLRKNGPS